MAGNQTFPSGADYAEAIQNPRICFQDPELRDGRPELTGLRQPRPISGNFASVFSMTSPSGLRYAVKCFTRDVADQRSRYEAISRHLAGVDDSSLSQPWRMDFSYLPDGILVRGTRWPVLKMAWVDGTGLISWLETHRADRVAVHKLADRFAALVADLENARIGHGDLQHGNLLVAPDGTLRLVDYDGMFVPALASARAVEEGHRHYQAPMRRNSGDYNETIDRFSAWVIYLSLMALSVDSTLWDRLRAADAEHLLTCEEDYATPSASWRLNQLVATGGEVGRIAEMVRELAGKPTQSMPKLAPAPRGTSTNPVIGESPTGHIATGSAAPGASRRPAWLDDHIEHTPAPAPARFTRRRPSDAVFALSGLLMMALGLIAIVLDPLMAYLGFVVIAVGLVIADLGRRARPEWRTARDTRRSRAKQISAFGDPAGRLQQMERDRVRQDTQISQQIDAVVRDQREAVTRRVNDVARVDRTLAGQLSAISQRKQRVEADHSRRITSELERIRTAHVQDRLRRHTIHQGIKGINGLGPAAAATLSAHGVRSAADVQIALVAGSAAYSSRMAYFLLPGGSRTRIEGIGEVKAKALLAWRDGLTREALRSAPTSLPAGQESALRNAKSADLASLDAEYRIAEDSARLEKTNLNVRAAQEATRLADRHKELSAELAGGRVKFSSEAAALRDQVNQRNRVVAAADVERRGCRRLRLHRYLVFAVFGS
ncbi:hypothetical protein ABH920_006471 [Catenulispora sp. EB89]|uniref:hypothetical protein n=1 Tax=Catenulispora sp. EB89 TaxID=3156257 RepID=UPI0035136227